VLLLAIKNLNVPSFNLVKAVPPSSCVPPGEGSPLSLIDAFQDLKNLSKLDELKKDLT
jgi:hypothetical protein